jgi:ADP-heptose:LPS heptosyltransferase
LKKQGYHVTVFSSLPGASVIEHDPNIDELVLFDKDQVPNADLVHFWDYNKKQYDHWVNLSETVEGTFLALPGRTAHGWSPLMRHKRMNENYVEFQHEMAGVAHDPQVKFYATDEEKEWAKKTRAKMGRGPVVMWSLAGSSVHKTWPYLDNIIASFMVTDPDAQIVLVGGPECVILEQGWDKEPRVHCTSGKWSIRQSLAFLAEADLVIGPETGVLNAAACMEVPKIVFLSHSTHENLTRDWRNVFPLSSVGTVCPGRGNDEAPACHQLHYGWGNCKKDESTDTAQCQADISGELVWETIKRIIKYHMHPLKAS